MPAGRPPKPTALKVLQGNPGKRPLNEAEPRPERLVDLRPPAGLDAYGRQCWNQHAPMLDRLGLLKESDRIPFAVFCETYSRWRRATRELHRTKVTDEGYRPLALTVEKCEQALRMQAIEFGMTPAARARLSVDWGSGKAPADDPMERLLSGRRSG